MPTIWLLAHPDLKTQLYLCYNNPFKKRAYMFWFSCPYQVYVQNYSKERIQKYVQKENCK